MGGRGVAVRSFDDLAAETWDCFGGLPFTHRPTLERFLEELRGGAFAKVLRWGDEAGALKGLVWARSPAQEAGGRWTEVFCAFRPKTPVSDQEELLRRDLPRIGAAAKLQLSPAPWLRSRSAGLLHAARALGRTPRRVTRWYEARARDVVLGEAMVRLGPFSVDLVKAGFERLFADLPPELAGWSIWAFTEAHVPASLTAAVLRKGRKAVGVMWSIGTRYAREEQYDGFFGWRARLGANGLLIRSGIVLPECRLGGGGELMVQALLRHGVRTLAVNRIASESANPVVQQYLESRGFRSPFVTRHERAVLSDSAR